MQIKRYSLILLIVYNIISFSGCSMEKIKIHFSLGSNNLSYEIVKQFKIGQTTCSDVKNILGTPISEKKDSKFLTLLYEYNQWSLQRFHKISSFGGGTIISTPVSSVYSGKNDSISDESNNSCGLTENLIADETLAKIPLSITDKNISRLFLYFTNNCLLEHYVFITSFPY